MDINILVVLIIIALALIIKRSNVNARKGLVIYAYAIAVIFILQSGLRTTNEIYGNDTNNYMMWFNSMETTSWQDVVSDFRVYGTDYDSRDPGFSVVVKTFQLFTTNYRAFLLFVACIIVVPIVRLMLKQATSIEGMMLGFLIYEVILAPFFDTAIRQTIAMGIVFMSIGYVFKRKLLPFLLVVCAASLVHSSALIFIPVYWLSNLRRGRLLVIATIILYPIILKYAEFAMAVLGQGSIMESYVIESENNLGTPVFSAILVVINILLFLSYKQIDTSHSDTRLFVIAMPCALILSATSWVDSNFIRLTFYYLFFLIPFASILLTAVSQQFHINKSIVYVCATALIIGLLIL